MNKLSPQRARERALFRYRNALERGDFETIMAVLKMAERDSILTQMIEEMAELDDIPMARPERRIMSLFRSSKGITEVVIRRDPSPDGWPHIPDQSEDQNDMFTTFVPLRSPYHTNARTLRWDPITLAVAALVVIVLGALLLFMRAAFNSGAGGEPETQTLSQPDATSIRITPENAGQVTQLGIFASYNNVTSLAWSPDGETVALGSDNGLVFLLDPNALDSPPRVLAGHTQAVWDVAFSPDQTTLASGGRQELILWDIPTGEQRTVIDVSSVTRLTFSHDGTMLAGARGLAVWLWDVQNSQEIAILSSHESSVNSVAFSSDGAVLISGSTDKTLRLWNVSTGAELAVLVGHEEGVQSVVFSPNGAIIASGDLAGNVLLWDWNGTTGTQQIELRGHTEGIRAIAFSPDGTSLASASLDHSIRLWNVATGESRVLEGHLDQVRRIAFSPDGLTLASLSADATLRLWDVATGAALRTKSLPLGHSTITRTPPSGIAMASFSPDGNTIVSSGYDGSIVFWDAGTGAQQTFHDDRDGGIMWSVVFSPDGTLLASSARQKLRLWDVATATELGVFDSVTGVVDFSPDGTLLAASGQDYSVAIYDVATRQQRAALPLTNVWPYMVSFSPDGSLLASTSEDSIVRLWDLATGEERAVLEGHTAFVQGVAWSPDGTMLASCAYDGTMRLWDVATGEQLDVLAGQEEAVITVDFSPDGRLLVSAGGSVEVGAPSYPYHSVRLWDVATGEQLAVLEGHSRTVNSAFFNPDGTEIVSASEDGTIRLWGVPTETSEGGS
jgi:WD40 repeat protein